MEEKNFQIVLNMYTCNGYAEIGRFSVGNAEEDAAKLFEQLKGNKTIEEKIFIRLDFIFQKEDSLNILLHTLGCTLNEMTENVKIILKETFIKLNIILEF